MPLDELLAPTDTEEALSKAYVHALAAMAGYVVGHKDFDRDGVDLTIEAGDAFRPKLDVQLKATVGLKEAVNGIIRYPCRKRNYDLLRIPTQTPRILIILALPRERSEWMTVTGEQLVIRRKAYWVDLKSAPETKTENSITIDVYETNHLDVDVLRHLMDRSRSGSIS